MVEFQPSKLAVRVRFPSPAPCLLGKQKSDIRFAGIEGRGVNDCRWQSERATALPAGRRFPSPAPSRLRQQQFDVRFAGIEGRGVNDCRWQSERATALPAGRRFPSPAPCLLGKQKSDIRFAGIHKSKYRGIAQLVEQRSPKPRVQGSSPCAPAKRKTAIGGFFFCVWGSARARRFFA